jgi:hypothetical protein
MMPIKQDLAAGLIFVAFGVAGLYFGAEYELGVARSMGPGYLPTLLCWGLILLGSLIAIKGLIATGDAIGHGRIRPLVFVLAAVGTFALTIEAAGLAIAVFAGERVRPAESFTLALLLAVSAVAVFIYGLSLPISALPF